MEEFFLRHQNEIMWTTIIITVLLISKFIITKGIKRIGRVSNIFEGRTMLISRYVSILFGFLGILILSLIWSVDYRELGLLFSSVFAVIGVALFASWSILSNITSGIVLFFFFPFKIGDRIKILDKEIGDISGEEYQIFSIENIKAFHVRLRNEKGQIVTYPNNMMLQKGITLIETPYNTLHEDNSE